ncbi:Rossmann-fold NAD(P)-binding domain-containing protein [Mesoterricola silvestris]|uniref:Uncharacterized protein n=1 Tax=Mesoterricola silvestris TaxID=2927979 RepID=A0AA48KA73_9BACT|nr:hypothetical protein [Mesoterricola silvestris]BDU73820.1 hypothetical protein METEAL_29940 [Mesoterricola silvestris]
MRLFGDGRAALAGDPVMAERLGWGVRKRSSGGAEIVLAPVDGDPRAEPWIARGRVAPGGGVAVLWEGGGKDWTYLRDAPGVPRYLRRMAEPARGRSFTVGISGLGRVGGLAASALAACAGSGIGTLLIHDCDGGNLERMVQELGSVARWRAGSRLPQVEAAGLGEMMRRCDAFLFAAASAVPPLGTEGEVRLTQFGPNRECLKGALEAANAEGFAGLFLMVSDPVEVLAQTAFHDSNAPEGAWLGTGLAPERVGGLALGVMWGRAMAAAEAAGQGERVARRGVPYGPHSTEVLVYDDPAGPDPALCEAMTRAARTGNYRVRDLGFLPYIGPALSSIVLTLPRLLAGREVLASSFVDGVYFGSPCRLRWGLGPTRRRLAPEVKRQVEELHLLLQDRMARLGLSWR